MPGPGAAAGAKAAGAAAGRVGGGAASRSGAAQAAKRGGAGAASRSAAGKSSARQKSARSVGRLIAFRVRRGRGGGDPEMFSSGFVKLLGVAGACLMVFIVVVIAPLMIFEATASGCGEEEGGGGDEAVPIQTNHQTEPEDMSETQVAIRIYLVGQVMHMTPRQIVGAFATGYVETHMQNLHWATEGSRGVFMQRGFSPWTDGGRNRLNVIDASISFFLRMRELDTGQPIGELDWQVQQPAEQYRYRYALWVDEGIEMYEKIHRLLGTAAGVKSIESLQGVTIGSSGLGALSLGAACSGMTATGPANVKGVATLYQPRSFKTLPSNLWVGGGEAEQVDTRIWPDAVWVMTNYHLRATAARETGHHTHGDGTAIDMVPADGSSQADWDNSALRLARDLGWTGGCGGNGLTKSAGGLCDLVPSVIFIGYNGYEGHGDPAHVGSNAHIHVSWYNSCYGCGGGALVPPRDWVKVFPVGEEEDEEEPAKAKAKGGKGRGGAREGKA